MKNKTWFGLISALGLAGLAGFLLVRPETGVGPHQETAVATSEQLKEVSELSVYFAHQSVGRNLLAALPAVYAEAGLEAPEIVESDAPPRGPVFQHSNIHQNRDPLGKIAEFDRIIRAGVGEAVDVAILKLCYVDFHQGDDIDLVFETYRTTLAALERDYPEVAFVHSTVPVTADRGPRGRVEDRLNRMFGQPTRLGAEHNVIREQLNQKLRAQYADSGRLYDIAAIQSTRLDGTRIVGTLGGETFYAMDWTHAVDSGHLNPQGAEIAVSALLATIADGAAARRPA